MIDLRHGDCLELMKSIPGGSIDMILCDLPYGVTECRWDSVIPFDALWEQYARIAKANAAIVLTASQPFTTSLISSNTRDFKYCWYWVKNLASGFQLAKIQPRRAVEEIVVFYRNQPTYNRQLSKSKINDRVIKVGSSNGGFVKNSKNEHKLGTKPQQYIFPGKVSPTNVLEILCEQRSGKRLHPTQKPVALMEYLINTYTNAGDTVLDSCMGSGTTGVACANTNRKFIGMEMDQEYFSIASNRIAKAQPDQPAQEVEK